MSMRYFDPEQQNYGFEPEDIFPLLPWADERKNKTFFIGNPEEEGYDYIRIETDFTGRFVSPSYMGDRWVQFKFIYRITTHIRKTKMTTYRQVFVDLDE